MRPKVKEVEEAFFIPTPKESSGVWTMTLPFIP